jgi:DNA-binding NtrC family response regulator
MIMKALKKFKWNKTKVAEALKVDYKTLYNKMKEYGL